MAALAEDQVLHSPERDWKKLGIQTWELRQLERVPSPDGIYAWNVAYKSGDLNITGLLARPDVPFDEAGRPKETLPAVILNHGSESGVTPAYRAVAMEFARRGYVVAASTYRGQRGLEGRSEGLREFAKGEVIDVLQLAQLARKLDYVDSLRVSIVGFGHGGSITAQAIGRSNVFRAAVVVSPILFSALPDTGYAGLQQLRDIFQRLRGRSLSEGELVRELRARESFQFVGRIETPVLAIVTDRDPVAGATLEWVKALNAHSVENQLARYPRMFPDFMTAPDDGTRPPGWRQDRDNAWAHVFHWIESHVPPERLEITRR